MALTKVIGNGLGTLGDGTANDTKIVFDGNAQDYHIGLDDSADTLVIGKGSALGTTTSMSFDANGIITKPLQPAFCANLSSTLDAIPASSSMTTIPFATERFDQNADFDTSNYTFTAPVTGRYLFTFMLYLFNNLDTSSSYYYVSLNSSNRDYDIAVSSSMFGSDISLYQMTGSVIADMDASDTMYLAISQSGGAQQCKIATTSSFSGALIC